MLFRGLSVSKYISYSAVLEYDQYTHHFCFSLELIILQADTSQWNLWHPSFPAKNNSCNVISYTQKEIVKHRQQIFMPLQATHSIACSWGIMFSPCRVVRPDVCPVPSSACQPHWTKASMLATGSLGLGQPYWP